MLSFPHIFGAFNSWKRSVNTDPARQPPCFIAPDGKILRSSDYKEVF